VHSDYVWIEKLGFDYRMGHKFSFFVTMFCKVLGHSASLQTGNEDYFSGKSSES
jgi:hypothetical protein